MCGHMEIGLIRHFPVDYRFKRWSDSSAFDRDMDHYDKTGIIIPESRINPTGWDVCYCSTMSRAMKTAEILLGTGIIPTDLLREVPLRAGFHTRLRLPLALWALIGRIQWRLDCPSQPESREKTTARILDFYRKFCLTLGHQSRILVVTHGFFMVCFRKFLKKNGFSGPFFLKPGNGAIYRFRDNRKNADRYFYPPKNGTD